MFQVRSCLGKFAWVVFMLCLFSEESRAATLSGSFQSIPAGSNVNLSAIGKLDWVHWGLYTDTSLNRKGSVSPQISSFTLVGDSNSFLAAYQYADNFNGYSWYDGAPVASVTNTTTGVWAYSFPVAIGAGFQITVPADTTERTLQVFVGAFSAAGRLEAVLSDGSAPSFTSSPVATVNNLNNGPSGVFALDYAAGSAGQTLTVTWTLATARGAGGNVSLQAAALTAANADNPPFVVVTNPTNNAAFPEPATLVLHAAAQDLDGTVTNFALFANANKLGETAGSSFSFNWANVPRGVYTVRASATDNAGVTSSSRPVKIFVYGTQGTQTNSVEPAPASVDLTAEGSADWTHWGLVSNTSFDHKRLVQQKISNFAATDTNAVQRYADNYTAFSWSDGSPTTDATATTTGVFITGATNGFQLTAPADTEPRQLRLYVGGYGVQAEFQAFLSDLSAPPYTDTTVSNVYDSTNVVYTINYSAASSGQQLIVNYHPDNLFDLAYGNVTLQAATLQGGPSALLPIYIIEPFHMGNAFSLSFMTQSNHNYLVQYVDALTSSNWITATNVSGTGAKVTVTNETTNAEERYYRVKTE